MAHIELPTASVTAGAVCLSTDVVGDVVRISGPQVGALLQVTRVDITNLLQTPAVGVLVSKQSATTCQVVLSGVAEGLSPLTPGRMYTTDIFGRLAIGKPLPGSGQTWRVQSMGYALSTDAFMVRASLPTLIKG